MIATFNAAEFKVRAPCAGVQTQQRALHTLPSSLQVCERRLRVASYEFAQSSTRPFQLEV
jgi:hypothetical protein